MITGFNPQDTIKPKLVIRINTDNLISDSVFRKLDEVPEHIRADSARLKRRTSASSGNSDNRYNIGLLQEQHSRCYIL